jgi:hypothetical protein
MLDDVGVDRPRRRPCARRQQPPVERPSRAEGLLRVDLDGPGTDHRAVPFRCTDDAAFAAAFDFSRIWSGSSWATPLDCGPVDSLSEPPQPTRVTAHWNRRSGYSYPQRTTTGRAISSRPAASRLAFGVRGAKWPLHRAVAEWPG